MIDVHNHILPGVDDGASDMASALEMARILEDLGFDTVAASPHLGMGPGGDVCPRHAAEVRAELSAALVSEGISLKLLPNSEHHVTPELFERILSQQVVPVGGESRWLLIELPWMPLNNVADVLFRIRTKGFKVLLAHPERYKYLSNEEGEKLVAQGIRFQLELGSFVGFYGGKAQDKAMGYMRSFHAHVLASDLHAPQGAGQWLGKALDVIRDKWGGDALELGLRTNPQYLIDDGDVDDLKAMGGDA